MNADLEKQLEDEYFSHLLSGTLDATGHGWAENLGEVLKLEKILYGKYLSAQQTFARSSFQKALARYKALPLIAALEEV